MTLATFSLAYRQSKQTNNKNINNNSDHIIS